MTHMTQGCFITTSSITKSRLVMNGRNITGTTATPRAAITGLTTAPHALIYIAVQTHPRPLAPLTASAMNIIMSDRMRMTDIP